MRVGVAKAAVLFAVLLSTACGNVSRKQPTPNGTGGSATTPEPMAEAGAAGAAGASEPGCLFPSRLSKPLQGEPDVLDYQLSSPYPIDVEPTSWRGVRAAHDFNGDLASDLIYLNPTPREHFSLLLTAAPPNIFDFVPTPCPDLEELPVGRLFLRDLNDDGISDVIVGTTQGLYGYANQPQGLEPVLRFETKGERISIVNVVVADLDADGRSDIVLGYDEVISEAQFAFETGVQSFLQQPEGTFTQGEFLSTQQGPFSSQALYGGYFATGRFDPDGRMGVIASMAANPEMIGLLSHFEDGEEPTVVTCPGMPEAVYELFALPDATGHAVLGAVGYIGFHLLEVSGAPCQLLGSFPLLYGGGPSHELGGGPERPHYTFIDFDRDGDFDFIEHSAEPAVALHVNLGGFVFADAQVFAVEASSASDGSLVVVGPGTAFVTETPAEESPAAIRTLFSKKYSSN